MTDMNPYTIEPFLRKIRADANNEKFWERIHKNLYATFKRVDKSIVNQIANRLQKSGLVVPVLKLTKHAPLIDASAEKSVDLIRSIGREHLKGLEKVVSDAVKSGEDYEQVRKALKKTGEVSEKKAYSLAQDQVRKTVAQVNKRRQQDAGFPGYFWETRRDRRVRNRHGGLQGKYIYWDDPPVMDDGQTKHAGEDYNCRCFANPGFPKTSLKKKRETLQRIEAILRS